MGRREHPCAIDIDRVWEQDHPSFLYSTSNSDSQSRRVTMIRLIRTKMATALVRCLLALISLLALQCNLQAAPMVYTGFVVTDVRVGANFMHNA